MSARLSKATLLYQQGRFVEAELELREALAEGTVSPRVHTLLSLCLVRANLPEEARRELYTALALNPNDAYSYYALSFVEIAETAQKDAFGRGRISKPVTGWGKYLVSIRKAVELEPNNVNYLVRLAELLQMLGRWRESMEPARAALREAPTSCSAAIRLAEALIHLRKFKQAREVVYQALEGNPAESLAHAGMGWALLRAGDHIRAEQFFNEALRLRANLQWAQSGALECAKHKYRVHRWLYHFKLWVRSLHSFFRIFAILGVWAGILAFFIAYFRWADPLLQKLISNQGFAIFTLAWVLTVGFIFFFHNQIFLWFVRKERAAQTSVGTRSRQITGQVAILILVGVLLIPGSQAVAHFWAAGPMVLAAIIPGAYGLFLANVGFPPGKRRHFWMGYAILMGIASLLSVWGWHHFTGETPSIIPIFGLASLPLFVLTFAVKAGIKKSQRKKHFDALESAKRSRGR